MPKRHLNAQTQKLTVYTLIVIAVGVIGAIAYLRISEGGSPGGAPLAGQFELERQPRLGDPEAPLTMVFFEDYSCPACRAFEEDVFPRIKREYVEPGHLQVYALNFQFLGPDSVNAALAAECVHAQSESHYWEYKTYIYRAQGPQGQPWASNERLLDLAQEGVPDIDLDELQACMDERRYEDDIQRDREIGSATGVQGTPSIFVEGFQVSSPSYADVSAAIERALGDSR